MTMINCQFEDDNMSVSVAHSACDMRISRSHAHTQPTAYLTHACGGPGNKSITLTYK